MGKIILVSGKMGSGKSVYANKLAKEVICSRAISMMIFPVWRLTFYKENLRRMKVTKNFCGLSGV